ncbi:hypothetical protein B0H15DRAFT_964404 [Mycena belliarum]|uniref:Ser-Thr-rich glycosyl-phosphatidyl-inositol-anchored membrane family-domain-containing protein n=1 Tax=Mycena belliarum TaxID=1033014 RepID=A0AAD6XQD3_9AGAR|nr:hypothetical protein B0H15DRAFT_964404 [Mycena belliae]
MFPLTFIGLFSLFSSILAAPLDTRTVYAPPITNPTADSVWKVGEVETVTWQVRSIMLGYLTPDSEHLSLTLASGFNLTDEKVNVTVPPVVSRTNYIVVLFGDSGNHSPEFTIQGTDGTSASSAATSSKSASRGASSAVAPTGGLSITPTRLPTSSSSGPPASALSSPSSVPGSSSSSLPTSVPAVTSPSPSPSPNAGWSTNRLLTYQALMAPAVLLLVL